MNKITENLWIGDIQDARERSTDRFDKVVTVCQDSVSDNVGCDYSHYNMADGETNEYGGECNYDIFSNAVEDVLRSVRDGKTTLVHCHAGRSRSASVCATVISVIENAPYSDAIHKINRERHVMPDYQLVQYARRFIEEHE